MSHNESIDTLFVLFETNQFKSIRILVFLKYKEILGINREYKVGIKGYFRRILCLKNKKPPNYFMD